MSNSSSNQTAEMKAMEFATRHFLSFDKDPWQDALKELETAVDENRRLIGSGVEIWEPFEKYEEDQIFDRIHDMASDILSMFNLEQATPSKRLMVVHENEGYQYTLANFDASDIEILHVNFEKDFQEPGDMIKVMMSNGKEELAFSCIDTPQQETETSLKVDSVYALTKAYRES